VHFRAPHDVMTGLNAPAWMGRNCLNFQALGGSLRVHACRDVNTSGGNRTHTLVPQERILSPAGLPYRRRSVCMTVVTIPAIPVLRESALSIKESRCIGSILETDFYNV
jgi:hypothetical protein